uniref:RING-type domain-containing protein n=1 Tax=Strigamia maritima TaxID=126957 RepID=T1JDY7_STRMM
MPTSLFPDMDRNSGGLEDQRALQLALELSMLAGLSSDNEDGLNPSTFDNENRGKKSQNMTECVPVPSSEHVAEIVGRQGCKIKALRAKTNTYIKTPVRGEEPVFVVTGRKEDVSMAKREILSAAEHFSQIRASRKNNMNGSLAPGPPNNVPGQTTIQVRVPYRVVGLVVGPKGATIKRIQQQTHTYIVTPSREKEPVFEVTGLPENVESARKEIEAHIAMRTGGMIDANEQNDFHTNGVDGTYSTGSNDLVSSLYKPTSTMNGLNSAFSSYCDGSNNHHPLLSPPTPSRSSDAIFNFGSSTTNGTSGKASDFTNFSNGFPLYDTDEGISESPTFDPAVGQPTSIWAEIGRSSAANVFGSSSATTLASMTRRSSTSGGTPRLSPTLTDNGLIEHPPARRIRSDPLSLNGLPAFSSLPNGNSSGGLVNGFHTSNGGSTSSSPTDSLGSGRKNKRDCIICFESEIVAALVPCGHNLFCLECANRLYDKNEPECPVCHQTIAQVIRIYS